MFKFIILLDNFNLFITFLGLLYKSSSGVKSCAKGGIFGLTAAALWAFLLKKDQRISDYMWEETGLKQIIIHSVITFQMHKINLQFRYRTNSIEITYCDLWKSVQKSIWNKWMISKFKYHYVCKFRIPNCYCFVVFVFAQNI